MVDVELEPRMALRDLLERVHVAAGEKPDRQSRLFASGPEPVERTIGPPVLLMRLVESKTEPEHARPLAPAGDDFFSVRALQIEMPEDAELVRVQPHRLDCLGVDGLAEGAWRMD